MKIHYLRKKKMIFNLTFAILVITSVLSLIKNFNEGRKKTIEALLIIVTLATGIYGLMEQRKSTSQIKAKAEKDSINHVVELDSAKNRMSILKTQYIRIDSNLHSEIDVSKNLSTSIKLLSESYAQNSEVQAGVNEFVTGGDNLPIIRIGCNQLPNKNQQNYVNPDSIKYGVSFNIANDGYVPLKNVIVKINNGIDNISYEQKFASLTKQYGPHLKAYNIPPNKDTIYFDGTVIWDGATDRAYFFYFTLVKQKDAFRSYAITKKYYRPGDKLVGLFDPDTALKNYLARSKRKPPINARMQRKP